MPVAFSISVLSRDRRSKAFKRRTADPSNLRPVMHQSKIAVETVILCIILFYLTVLNFILNQFLYHFKFPYFIIFNSLLFHFLLCKAL